MCFNKPKYLHSNEWASCLLIFAPCLLLHKKNCDLKARDTPGLRVTHLVWLLSNDSCLTKGRHSTLNNNLPKAHHTERSNFILPPNTGMLSPKNVECMLDFMLLPGSPCMWKLLLHPSVRNAPTKREECLRGQRGGASPQAKGSPAGINLQGQRKL